ncbi:MAG: hypothetical protein H0V88_09370 [Pyrinomonadaceae bacterium]|nr:hypothetical protein [Pyrinomonadaceae bacterium]
MEFDEDKIVASSFDELRGETQRFSTQEMVVCPRCARRSPPTRMKCLYCGAALPETEATKALRRPALKTLEEWEQGFNVVLLPDGSAAISDTASHEASALLRLGKNAFEEMLKVNVPLPLARVATEDEAQLLEKRFGELNFAVEIIPDVALVTETKVPKRVRQLQWTDDEITFTTKGSDESQRIRSKDIMLLVLGRLRKLRIEVEEGRGRRGGDKEVVESREMFEDESVLDVHASATGLRWRIAAENFDFSCLGERKNLLVAQNFRTLTDELRGRAITARFCDDYTRLRPFLAHAWPLTERTEAGGLRRSRPGRFHTEAATIMNNEAQFTRYSCLLHHLELRRRVKGE